MMTFEQIDVAYNLLVVDNPKFTNLSIEKKEEALLESFPLYVAGDLLRYNQFLASCEMLERELIAEQHYGNQIQYTETFRDWAYS